MQPRLNERKRLPRGGIHYPRARPLPVSINLDPSESDAVPAFSTENYSLSREFTRVLASFRFPFNGTQQAAAVDLMEPRRPLSSQSSSAGCASVTADAVAWSLENNLFFFSFFFSINTALNSLATYHFAVTIVPQRLEDILQYGAVSSHQHILRSLRCDNADGCFGVCLAQRTTDTAALHLQVNEPPEGPSPPEHRHMVQHEGVTGCYLLPSEPQKPF